MLSLRKFIVLAIMLLPISAGAQEDGVESLRKTSKAFAEVARKVSPSVVLIQVEDEAKRGKQQNPFGLPFGDGESFPFGEDLLRRFFGDKLPDFRFHAPGGQRPAI